MAVEARALGLQDALRAAKLEEAPVIPCSLSEAGGYQGIGRLLKEHRGVSASSPPATPSRTAH